ncbi:Mu transposase C-terminal domain-containing protein [Streptomyces phaeochromogenes]|uniref:Mu transposase C-terminal domain-containing protein n=1 Tax=Streptomyces phaeochromogenes TaxID=1923 RepID=UPI0033E95C1D
MLLGAAGMIPLPLAGQHYGELLSARRCALTESGIRLGGRRYDHECLDEHRGRACPTADDGRWEVHHHPYDIRQVYVRLPDGLLHEIPWTEHAHVLRPFDDAVRRRTGQILAARNGPPRHPVRASSGRGQEAGDPVARPGRGGGASTCRRRPPGPGRARADGFLPHVGRADGG